MASVYVPTNSRNIVVFSCFFVQQIEMPLLRPILPWRTLCIHSRLCTAVLLRLVTCQWARRTGVYTSKRLRNTASPFALGYGGQPLRNRFICLQRRKVKDQNKIEILDDSLVLLPSVFFCWKRVGRCNRVVLMQAPGAWRCPFKARWWTSGGLICWLR